MAAEVKGDKFEDVVLLDLKMKDEAMSQRRQVVSRDRKRPGTRSIHDVLFTTYPMYTTSA